MFRKRLLSGVVLVIIALATVITGGNILFLTVSLISLVGMMELYRVLGIHRELPGLFGYGAAIVYYGILYFQRSGLFMMLSVFFLMILMCIYVFGYPQFDTGQVTGSFFGFFYTAVMLSCLYLTRMEEDGAYLVWLIFLSSWGSDTCAYCVGMLIGRHKLAPILSPKKSVEGGIGGIIGAALLGSLYGLLFQDGLTGFQNPVLACTVICALGSLLSQVGDLAASAIKRQHDIKDYGKLIPGHGGILDRFDSMIFTAPVIYFAAMFFR